MNSLKMWLGKEIIRRQKGCLESPVCFGTHFWIQSVAHSAQKVSFRTVSIEFILIGDSVPCTASMTMTKTGNLTLVVYRVIKNAMIEQSRQRLVLAFPESAPTSSLGKLFFR
jgi:hypothetical protein